MCWRDVGSSANSHVIVCVSPQKQTVLRKRCKEKFPYSMTLHRNVRSFGANNQVQGWEKQVFITQPIWQVQREVNRNSENHRWDSSTPYSHPYSGVCEIDADRLLCKSEVSLLCVSQCLLCFTHWSMHDAHLCFTIWTREIHLHQKNHFTSSSQFHLRKLSADTQTQRSYTPS